MELIALPYQKNTVDLFGCFEHLAHAVLLNSASKNDQNARYDIISALPETVITVNQSDTNTEPFMQVKEALSILKQHIENNTHNLPFTVGAIGYLSYDIGRHLEAIPKHAIDDISMPQAVIGIYHWSILVDHQQKKCTLITLQEKGHPTRQCIQRCLDTPIKAKPDFQLRQPFKSNLSTSQYSAGFSIIKKHIYDGNCYQVNFAQRLSTTFHGSTWRAYQRLQKKHPAPFSAFIRTPQGTILSLSPERFLKVTDNHVETKPIKGTMPRFSDPVLDRQSANALILSEKDKAENLMIVDLLRNDLSRVCKPGSVAVPKLFALESFSNVHHLVSTITGTLKDTKTAIDLFKHCFPGGSITGAPKIAAMKIIEELEPHRRSVYCGSIFYADFNGNFDSNIAIRTLICENNGAIHCYAGGGIVYDSECDKEYSESWSKIGKIIETLSDSNKDDTND